MNNLEKVYAIVKKIPKGKVATYSQVAKLSGIKSPRVVGNILHKNTNPDEIPCHRVVNVSGRLAHAYAFGGEAKQKIKLHKEGLVIINNQVNLQKYLWDAH